MIGSLQYVKKFSGRSAIVTAALVVFASAAVAQSPATNDEQSATDPAVVRQQTIERLQRQLDEIQQELSKLKQAPPAGIPAPSDDSATVASAAKSSAPIPAPAEAAPSEATAMAADAPVLTGPHSTPFAFADFTWLNGNSRTKDTPYATKFFTPEIRADVNYVYDFRHPKDDTIGGSSEIFRSSEVQLTQLGVGGDFHYDNVRARVMTQFGLYSETTPRNDASPARGQWNLADAYRYLSEAYGGYHLNVQHGVNVDAGIFMSYVGLFSYYQFDNWAYQPSYVSSNTPWFFKRCAGPVVSDRQAEDRALVCERLAVVWALQQSARNRRADPLSPEREAVDPGQPVCRGPRRSGRNGKDPLPTPTTASSTSIWIAQARR